MTITLILMDVWRMSRSSSSGSSGWLNLFFKNTFLFLFLINILIKKEVN